MHPRSLYWVYLLLRVSPSIERIRWLPKRLLLQLLVQGLRCSRAFIDLRLNGVLLSPHLGNQRALLLDACLHVLDRFNQFAVQSLFDPVVLVLLRSNGLCEGDIDGIERVHLVAVRDLAEGSIQLLSEADPVPLTHLLPVIGQVEGVVKLQEGIGCCFVSRQTISRRECLDRTCVLSRARWLCHVLFGLLDEDCLAGSVLDDALRTGLPDRVLEF